MNASAADLLLAHEHLIRSLARDLLNDDDHAVDDVVQQTWLVALHRSPRVADALGSWLARVARNFALRSMRARARRRTHEERGAQREAVPSASAILQREETRREVVRAVLALAEPERAVTVLRYFEGLPPRAIARRLAISVDTVQNRLKRGRAELRRELDRRHDGDQHLLSRMLVPLAGATPAPVGAWLGSSSLVGVLVMTIKVKLALVAALVLVVGTSVVLWHLASERTPSAQRAGAESRATQDVDEMPAGGAAASSAVSPAELAPDRAPVDARPPVEQKAAVPETGSLLVRARWQGDRSPAEGIVIHVSDRNRPSRYFQTRVQVTGSDGAARFADLPPGALTVGRGIDPHTSAANVVAGSEAEVLLEIPSGMSVEGVVVDGSGAPVAGAEIVSGRAATLPRLEHPAIGRSAADGTFRLKGIRDGDEIAARAPGYAPSSWHWLSGDAGVSRRVRLVLDHPGGEVEGDVVDAAGDPIANALVRVKLGQVGGYRPTEGGVVGKPTDVWARSDEAGHFAMFAVPIGTFSLEARASDFGVWRGSVDVSAQVTAQVDVVLQRAASVHGVITTAAGQPAPGVSVRVGAPADVMSSTTRTAADGQFVLPDVAPGEIAIEADGEELGKASGIVIAASGEDVKWEASLSTGLLITGRVLDEADLPVARCSIHASPTHREDSDEGHYFAFAVTDANGRFVLQNLKAVSHFVELKVSGNRVAVKEDVSPGAAELLFRMPRDQTANATITGRIVDPGGNPIEGARISPTREGSNSGPVLTSNIAGRFSIGGLLTGRYGICVSADQRPSVLAPRHDLRAGETWDAGDIVVPVAGALEVQVRRAAGTVTTDPALWLVSLDETAPPEPLAIAGDVARAGNVAPGKYVVAVTGDDHAHLRHAVEVRAGETSKVEVVVEAGFQKVLRLRRAVPRAPELVRVAMLDAGGSCVSEHHVTITGLTYDLVLCQLRGRYTIDASSFTGSGSVTVEIDATSSREQVVELTLR